MYVERIVGMLFFAGKKLGANAMEHVAAGAHLPTLWLFERAKHPDDRADYCLERRLLPGETTTAWRDDYCLERRLLPGETTTTWRDDYFQAWCLAYDSDFRGSCLLNHANC